MSSENTFHNELEEELKSQDPGDEVDDDENLEPEEFDDEDLEDEDFDDDDDDDDTL